MARYLVEGYKTPYKDLISARKAARKIVDKAYATKIVKITEIGTNAIGYVKAHPYLIGAIAFYPGSINVQTDKKFGILYANGNVDYSVQPRYI